MHTKKRTIPFHVFSGSYEQIGFDMGKVFKVAANKICYDFWHQLPVPRDDFIAQVLGCLSIANVYYPEYVSLQKKFVEAAEIDFIDFFATFLRRYCW